MVQGEWLPCTCQMILYLCTSHNPAPSPSVIVEGAVAQELSRNWLKLDHQLEPSTELICLSTAGVALVSQPDSILDTPGKREPQLRNRLHEISLWGHSLLHRLTGRAQPTVSIAIPAKVSLGYITKAAEQARGSQAVNGVPAVESVWSGGPGGTLP